MPKQNVTGFRRIINASRYSMQGFRAAYEQEAAFRLELFLGLLLAPFGLWLGEGGLEKAILLAVLFLVLIVELLNSAIEAVVDRIGDELHNLSGQAKDMGSAAVFLALANVPLTWSLVLLF